MFVCLSFGFIARNFFFFLYGIVSLLVLEFSIYYPFVGLLHFKLAKIL